MFFFRAIRVFCILPLSRLSTVSSLSIRLSSLLVLCRPAAERGCVTSQKAGAAPCWLERRKKKWGEDCEVSETHISFTFFPPPYFFRSHLRRRLCSPFDAVPLDYRGCSCATHLRNVGSHRRWGATAAALVCVHLKYIYIYQEDGKKRVDDRLSPSRVHSRCLLHIGVNRPASVRSARLSAAWRGIAVRITWQRRSSTPT